MPATTKNTKTSNRGGARKGAGRKPTGKKYYSYYLDPAIGDLVSEKDNPSKYIEELVRMDIRIENDLKQAGI